MLSVPQAGLAKQTKLSGIKCQMIPSILYASVFRKASVKFLLNKVNGHGISLSMEA